MSGKDEDQSVHPDVCTMTGFDNDQLDIILEKAKEDLRDAVEAYQSIRIPEELHTRVMNVIQKSGK